MLRRAILIALLALLSLGVLSVRPTFTETAKAPSLEEMRFLYEQTKSEAQWAKTFNNTALTVTGIVLGIVAIFGIAFTILYTRRIRDLTDEAREFRNLAEKSMEKTESYMERAAKVTGELEKRREDIEESIKVQVGQAIETIKAEVDKAVKAEVAGVLEDIDERVRKAVQEIDEKKERATQFGQFFDEARIAIEGKEFPVALKAIEGAIAIDSQSPFAWSFKALVFLRMGEYNESLSASSEAVKLDPDFYPARYNRACAHSLLDEKTQMLDELKRAISLNPKYKLKAKSDPSYKLHIDDEDFKKIVEEESPSSEEDE